MKDNLKILPITRFDNGTEIIIDTNSVIKSDFLFFDQKIMVDHNMCGLNLNIIRFKLREMGIFHTELKIFTKYFTTATIGSKTFILTFGKSIRDMISESLKSSYDADRCKIILQKNSEDKKYWNFSKTVVIPISDKTINISKNYFDINNYHNKWCDNEHVIKYLNNNGIDVSDVIRKNRDKVIDNLLTE